MRTVRRFCMMGVLVLLAAGMVGCGEKEIVITQYPDFYSQEMQDTRIAIVPFRNQTNDPHAAEVLSDELASALQGTGTYKNVLNRNHLQAMLDQRDLQQALAAGNNAALAQQFSNIPALADIKWILVGTVTTYTSSTRSERKFHQVPIVVGKGQVRMMRQEYTLTRNEANVGATAALIDVRSGNTVYTTAVPATWRQWSQGSPPSMDPSACLATARMNVVGQLVQSFAVTKRTIEVKPKETFRTARDLYDNEWEWEDTFSMNDTKAFVVLKLPQVCHRNRFKITIIREDTRTDLFSEELTWDKSWGGRGYPFNPAEIAAKGGGPGKYVAKFYSGPAPVLTYDFKIK